MTRGRGTDLEALAELRRSIAEVSRTRTTADA